MAGVLPRDRTLLDDGLHAASRNEPSESETLHYNPFMALFEPLFHGLNEAGVRYVVVGGVAVVLHGHARLTVDVDLAVDLAEAEARRAIDALVGLGLQPRVPVEAADFADRERREAWIRDRGMKVFSLIHPSNPLLVVDLFVEHPIPFEEMLARSVAIDVGGTTVQVASIPDLIRLKQLAGRPLDLSDIEHLEAILEAKTEERDG